MAIGLVVGFINGRERARGEPYRTAAIISQISVISNSENIYLAHVCNELARAVFWDVGSNSINVVTDPINLMRMRSFPKYYNNLNLEDIQIGLAAVAGASVPTLLNNLRTAVFGSHKNDRDVVRVFAFVAAAAGGVSGYYIGHYIGTSYPPDCDSESLQKQLESKESWAIIENSVYARMRYGGEAIYLRYMGNPTTAPDVGDHSVDEWRALLNKKEKINQ
ncbi:hypothetical protein [Azospirillum argentinense]|uniref:hypothetical protein n=1 Tax=Azospirillum argentinense TaxID=2970906 RepID=UPI0010C059AC|nr:hypothetical protein [Azospirillum argentinense]